MIQIKPYAWEGSYAEMRTSTGNFHDVELCAEVRADWMDAGERVILRSSEIVGYPESYFYDDHQRPSDPKGRGKEYAHRSFRWESSQVPKRLSANCEVKGKGSFTLSLCSERDFVDINLSIRNGLHGPMGPIDWHFCAIGFDCPCLGDPELARTFLFDGNQLRSLSELSRTRVCTIYHVAGADRFIPELHRALPRGSVEARKSVIVLESVCGRYAASLGFEQAYNIFSNPINMCFHADPYFGTLTKSGEEGRMRGRLYLIEGSASDAFDRYCNDFR